MILIFSNKEDSHPNNVIRYLNAWKVPLFRLNGESLLMDYKCSWHIDKKGADFSIRNVKNGLVLRGNEITAVWDRRPVPPSELPIIHSNEEINKHNLEEGHTFLSFLRYYIRDIYSIGSIVEDHPAASKMLQLAIAQSLGLRIPETYFSNMKDPIFRLAEKHQWLSLKSLYSGNVTINDTEEMVFFSQKVKSKDLLQQPEEAFTQTVSFVQNYVEKAYELRITVINQDIIACKIDSQIQDNDKGKIDWRQGYDYNLKHEIVELPENIKQFCLAFLQRIKLNFGCFDFIVTPEGEYVFLECNPNGQWLWIEMETGYDISKIMAKNLAKYENM
jgi:hypothetical protein